MLLLRCQIDRHTRARRPGEQWQAVGGDWLRLSTGLEQPRRSKAERHNRKSSEKRKDERKTEEGKREDPASAGGDAAIRLPTNRGPCEQAMKTLWTNEKGLLTA